MNYTLFGLAWLGRYGAGTFLRTHFFYLSYTRFDGFYFMKLNYSSSIDSRNRSLLIRTYLHIMFFSLFNRCLIIKKII